MKKFVLFAAFTLLFMAFSCQKDNKPEVTPFDPSTALDGAIPAGYYGYTEVSVPCGTDKVYIEYVGEGGTRTVVQDVEPVITVPTGGKDVEPFGKVKLLLEAKERTKVNVYYYVTEATKAGGDTKMALEDFPLDQVQFGVFGETRYVQIVWDYIFDAQNSPTYPSDVVFYDSAHDHTLRYKFAYTSSSWGAYYLEDAYDVENYELKGQKYINSCDHCGGDCPYCMPWGCSCNCGGVNSSFVGNGDKTGDDKNSTVVDPQKPGTSPTVDDRGSVIVDSYGTIIVDYAPHDATRVELPEPASYVTHDDDLTMYHSSGVVMFDDRWPTLPDQGYRYDYNDVVIEYDIEAVTVPDELLASQAGKEKVKVTLHVRSLGGDDSIGVGVVLENFNTENVLEIKESKTLDSGGHGQLPIWTETTLQENSLHYDPLATSYRTSNTLRPAVEIGRLQALNSVDGKKTGGLNSGNEEYQSKGKVHVFNPARKLFAAWGDAHNEQYEDGLADLYVATNRKLSDTQNMKLYNTIPGYVNVDGGLYTYTVEYYMKPRDEMSREQSAACLSNMIETVVNTTNQNFYIVKTDRGAVGLKGYEPLDVPVKDFPRGYKSKYEEIKAAYSANMDPTIPYLASNGMVWGFKCPTLTRHAWELIPFCVAYPNYEEWVKSNGATHADWYKDDSVNYTALVCEW